MEHRKRVRLRVEHPLVQRDEIFIRKKQKEVLETAQTMTIVSGGLLSGNERTTYVSARNQLFFRNKFREQIRTHPKKKKQWVLQTHLGIASSFVPLT